MEQLEKLTLGEKLVVGGCIAFILVALIFEWTTYGRFGYGAFEYPGGTWITFAVILAVILAGFILAVRLGNMSSPALPASWTWGMVYAIGCGLILLFVLVKAWRIIAAPGGGDFAIGFLLGAVATGAIVYGGYLLYEADKGGGFARLRHK